MRAPPTCSARLTASRKLNEQSARHVGVHACPLLLKSSLSVSESSSQRLRIDQHNLVTEPILIHHAGQVVSTTTPARQGITRVRYVHFSCVLPSWRTSPGPTGRTSLAVSVTNAYVWPEAGRRYLRERSGVALSGHPLFGTTAALTVLTGGLRLDRTAAFRPNRTGPQTTPLRPALRGSFKAK
jgi:hypothetical protein